MSKRAATAAGKQLGDFVKAELGGKGNVLGVGLGVPVPALETLMKPYEEIVTDGTERHLAGSGRQPD